MQKRYTRAQFEEYPIGRQDGGSYRFFENNTWSVYDARDKEAYDAIVEEPHVPTAKEQRADAVNAGLRAEIEALKERVAALEAVKETRRPKQASE